MRMKPGTIVAAGMMAALQAVPISAQVLPVRTMVIENRQVLLLPWDGPDLSGAASLAGVNVAVSTGEEFRTYRAAYRGRTYTAYVNVSGPPRRLAFDPAQRREAGVAEDDLTCPTWEADMLSGGVPASQALADSLIAAGYIGMRVRSFAVGTGPDDLNLVLWRWGDERPVRVVLVDDEGRLAGHDEG